MYGSRIKMLLSEKKQAAVLKLSSPAAASKPGIIVKEIEEFLSAVNKR